MATQKGTQYVNGIFQYIAPTQFPAKSMSPWFNSVSMLPTTSATMNERRTKGRWRMAHRTHLTTMPPFSAPSPAGFLNSKDQPFPDLHPQRSQVVISPEPWALFASVSTIRLAPSVGFRVTCLSAAIVGAGRISVNETESRYGISNGQRFLLKHLLDSILSPAENALRSARIGADRCTISTPTRSSAMAPCRP